MSNAFLPGNLVQARSRTWIVQSGSSDQWLKLRPIGGADDEITELMPSLEAQPVELARFPYPEPSTVGAFSSAELLFDGLRFQLRSGAGPFRSFGSIAVEPRSYQLVPLLMAMRQKTVRLLIADDVGVGKTVEAGLIVRELLDRGEISTFAVLCPPHLVDQWVSELSKHFNIDATALTASSASRLEKQVPHGQTLIDAFPVLVVSLDYIKSEKHRDYFQTMKLDLIVVDEAHTCVLNGLKSRQLRFELLSRLANDQSRHMLLLTATPHSGNQDGFYSLLSLLDPKYAELQHKPVKGDDPLRQDLAMHFIQRRRQDIAEWRISASDRTTGFPRRQTAEFTYRLNDEWDDFFEALQNYCRKIIDQSESKNRFIWYAVLALFRCASSSPAAAVQALRSRGTDKDMTDATVSESSDPEGPNDSDSANTSDVAPSGFLTDSVELNTLQEMAKKLRGRTNDPKVARLIALVKKLMADGFAPVIFCRYVETAHYVQQILKETLPKKISIACVTGELSPGERKEQVDALENAEKRILVATDCLSEGINLQKLFTAVVHYDLSWNPTRHEQREGRVDRFGQKAPEVRCTMLYGENNPVDGFILNVILRKSEKIRKELGIVVPVPQKEDLINKALIKAALFKKRKNRQGELQLISEEDQPELFSPEELQEIDTIWKDANETAKKNRTVFAQRAIHPEQIADICRAQQEVLGSHGDLVRFSRNACAVLGAHLEPIDGTLETKFRFPLNALKNPSIKQRFIDEGICNSEELDFDEMHRSSPFINVLSEGLVEQAIEGDGKLISRCAITQSADVQSITRLYLLRLRYQLRLAYRNQTKRYLLAEEILPVSVSGIKNPQWDATEKARALFTSQAQGNFDRIFAQHQIEQAIKLIEDNKSALENIARDRAQVLYEEHNKMKSYTADGSVTEVTPCLPVDVMAVFVLFPSDDQ